MASGAKSRAAFHSASSSRWPISRFQELEARTETSTGAADHFFRFGRVEHCEDLGRERRESNGLGRRHLGELGGCDDQHLVPVRSEPAGQREIGLRVAACAERVEGCVSPRVPSVWMEKRILLSLFQA
ncbi:hypothetical protein GGQ85_004031 [Nitrobacter vulgaris]|nr:hypothetical protein [Nitrobacter vulgaris]